MSIPPLPIAALLAVALPLASCGDRAEEASPPIDPAPAQSEPAPSVTLPRTGDITTGSLTPSTAPVRLPSDAEKQQALDTVIEGMRARQAAALENAQVTVNAAWPYEGYSTLSPDPASAIPARMVAVDLTVSGHTADFDPDDIEIVDGITMVSYGSDPHLAVIKGPGEVITDAKMMPIAPAPMRLLLIYAFPKTTRTFTLYYWGRNLLDKPRGFDAAGWSLPYPETPKAP